MYVCRCASGQLYLTPFPRLTGWRINTTCEEIPPRYPLLTVGAQEATCA